MNSGTIFVILICVFVVGILAYLELKSRRSISKESEKKERQ